MRDSVCVEATEINHGLDIVSDFDHVLRSRLRQRSGLTADEHEWLEVAVEHLDPVGHEMLCTVLREARRAMLGPN